MRPCIAALDISDFKDHKLTIYGIPIEELTKEELIRCLYHSQIELDTARKAHLRNIRVQEAFNKFRR